MALVAGAGVDRMSQAVRKNHQSLWVALAVTGAVLMSAFSIAGTSGPESDPRPFDPLSQEEQRQAVDATLQDPRVQAVLSDHHEIIGAALNTDKDRMKDEPDSRRADVWIYDYRADQTVWTEVDMRESQVASLLVTDELQPPLTAAEIERAGRMALEDPAAQQALGDRDPDGVDWIGRLWTGEADGACPKNRCVLVAFLVDGEYLPEPLVRVNLSRGVVDDLLDEIEDTGSLEGAL